MKGTERMNAGSNAVDIKRGIEEAVEDITKFLEKDLKKLRMRQ